MLWLLLRRLPLLWLLLWLLLRLLPLLQLLLRSLILLLVHCLLWMLLPR